MCGVYHNRNIKITFEKCLKLCKRSRLNDKNVTKDKIIMEVEGILVTKLRKSIKELKT